MATDLRPMLAAAGDLPTGAGWQFEFKWDGARLVVELEDGIRCWSRNLRDQAASWPELAGLADEFGGRRVVLDGEIVVMNSDARPDFGLLQRRLHVVDPASVARLVTEYPATYLVFDLLEFDGHDLRPLPLSDRRRLLDDLELDGPAWKTPPVFVDDGRATLDAAARLELEGVVAKRLDGSYRPGQRSDGWRKIKLVQRDQFCVLGYTRGSGRRSSQLGALVVGVRDGIGWRCTGSVGTGFDDATLQLLRGRLEGTELDRPVWSSGPTRADAVPVTPTLVCEVAYSGWTRDGVLRHPAYVGVVADRPPEEVELPPGAPSVGEER